MTRSFETRNVILWLGNDESLYRHLCKYVKKAQSPSYRELIRSLGYSDSRTPDGVDWLDKSLDFEDLDAFVTEVGGAK